MCRNLTEVRDVAAAADQLAQLQDDSSILITGLSPNPRFLPVFSCLPVHGSVPEGIC